MIYKYNKLVRDKIPEEIENQGKQCKYEILEDSEYEKELDKKLLEEVNEYISCHEEKEMADVFIVLTTICNKLNINLFDAVYNKEKENVTRNWDKEGG